ncbi:hypothetical protein Droror1_Dr00024068 [Drosera rotundifolia]
MDLQLTSWSKDCCFNEVGAGNELERVWEASKGMGTVWEVEYEQWLLLASSYRADVDEEWSLVMILMVTCG